MELDNDICLIHRIPIQLMEIEIKNVSQLKGGDNEMGLQDIPLQYMVNQMTLASYKGEESVLDDERDVEELHHTDTTHNNVQIFSSVEATFTTGIFNSLQINAEEAAMLLENNTKVKVKLLDGKPYSIFGTLDQINQSQVLLHSITSFLSFSNDSEVENQKNMKSDFISIDLLDQSLEEPNSDKNSEIRSNLTCMASIEHSNLTRENTIKQIPDSIITELAMVEVEPYATRTMKRKVGAKSTRILETNPSKVNLDDRNKENDLYINIMIDEEVDHASAKEIKFCDDSACSVSQCKDVGSSQPVPTYSKNLLDYKTVEKCVDQLDPRFSSPDSTSKIHKEKNSVTSGNILTRTYNVKSNILLTAKTKKDYEDLAPIKFYCGKCSYKCKRKSHFDKHLELHKTNKVYHCSECEYSTLSRSYLIRHLLSHRTDTICCDKCDFKTYKSIYLARHVRTRHSEDAKNKKDKKSSIYKPDMVPCKLHSKQNHQMPEYSKSSTDEKYFQCKECEYRTLRKEHYLRHVNNVHINRRPHLCDFCGKAFKRTDALNQHRVLHASNDPCAVVFYCEICGKGCRSQTQLNEHVTAHSDVRAFLCEICGASFKTRAVQRKHVLSIHTNPKSFACIRCSKKFNTNFALQRHLKQHNDSVECVNETTVQVTKNQPDTSDQEIIQDKGSIVEVSVEIVQESECIPAGCILSEAHENSPSVLDHDQNEESMDTAIQSISTYVIDDVSSLLFFTSS